MLALSFFGLAAIDLVEVAGLLVELARHRPQNQARTLANLPLGEIATMVGMLPKLLGGTMHRRQKLT